MPKKISLVILGILIVGASGYVLGVRNSTNSANWKLIETSGYFVSLPANWKYKTEQGMDSAVGKFIGDGAVLNSDYGLYGGSAIKDGDQNHTITYEVIDGRQARIVISKTESNGTTEIYFPTVKVNDKLPGMPTKLIVRGVNLTKSQQETVVKIFRTIDFKE